MGGCLFLCGLGFSAAYERVWGLCKVCVAWDWLFLEGFLERLFGSKRVRALIFTARPSAEDRG